jgi:hypothetical protein
MHLSVLVDELAQLLEGALLDEREPAPCETLAGRDLWKGGRVGDESQYARMQRGACDEAFRLRATG